MDFKTNSFYNIGIERLKGEALISSVIDYDSLKLRNGELEHYKPFEFNITEGKILYDIVGFQDTANFAISEKLNSLLNENNITGWNGYEIEINGADQKYYGFQVLSKCSKLQIPKEVGFYTGFKFDYNTWDGSDFFTPVDTALLFCTKRVYELFSKNKITNVELENINDVEGYSVGY